MVDGEREELDVTGVEGGNDVDVCGIIAITTKLRLCFLVVPGGSGSRIGLDTRGSRGRFGDNNVDGQIGGGGGCRAAEVGWKKDQANISGAGRVVRDQVMRFGDNTVAGSDEVGPRANVSTDNVKGVTNISNCNVNMGTLSGSKSTSILPKVGSTSNGNEPKIIFSPGQTQQSDCITVR